VYFNPLSPQQTEEIVRQAAKRLGVHVKPEVPPLIAKYTSEGRKAVRTLADTYGRAYLRQSRGPKAQKNKKIVITETDVRAVLRASRQKSSHTTLAGPGSEIGAVLGLGVKGFLGAPIAVEAAVFPSMEKGKGRHRFNRAAGDMAHDSFFNATSVIRRVLGDNLVDYDVHVNVVGGAKVDGPSAGIAVVTAIASCLREKPIPQDLAMTGELSLHGKVKPVGGVVEKIHGAQQAGVRKVFIPEENAAEVDGLFTDVEVIAVATIEDAFAKLWGDFL
jgi:ATP-dependent Lon protease